MATNERGAGGGDPVGRDGVVPVVGGLVADALGDDREVGSDRRAARQLGDAPRLGEQVAGADEHLGRDAAPVGTLAADQLGLDRDHGEPGLGEPRDERLSSGPETDNDDVTLVSTHAPILWHARRPGAREPVRRFRLRGGRRVVTLRCMEAVPATDEDRRGAFDELKELLSSGRIDAAEFATRSSKIADATTLSELAALVTDHGRAPCHSCTGEAVVRHGRGRRHHEPGARPVRRTIRHGVRHAAGDPLVVGLAVAGGAAFATSLFVTADDGPSNPPCGPGATRPTQPTHRAGPSRAADQRRVRQAPQRHAGQDRQHPLPQCRDLSGLRDDRGPRHGRPRSLTALVLQRQLPLQPHREPSQGRLEVCRPAQRQA